MKVNVVMTKDPVTVPRLVRCASGVVSVTAERAWAFGEQVFA